MKRRDFIKLLGSGAAAFPFAAYAQQANKVYRIGWLFSAVPLKDMSGSDPVDPVSNAFVHGLRDLGYIEGQNLLLERRSAEGKLERIDGFAAELVELNPDVIITGGGDFMAQALQRLTKTVPIISPYGDDPVGAGLVGSLAHPGGNVTGFVAYTDFEFETKRLQLLKEALPGVARVAYLAMKQVWESPAGKQAQRAARMLSLTLTMWSMPRTTIPTLSRSLSVIDQTHCSWPITQSTTPIDSSLWSSRPCSAFRQCIPTEKLSCLEV